MTDRRRSDATAVFANSPLGWRLASLSRRRSRSFSLDRRTQPGATESRRRGLNGSDGAVADPNAEGTIVVRGRLVDGGVTSVEFELDRTGAPVFIDEFESIALTPCSASSRCRARPTPSSRHGQRQSGDAVGAVAVDDEVWISNPVTGDFETFRPASTSTRRSSSIRKRLAAIARQPAGSRVVGIDDRAASATTSAVSHRRPRSGTSRLISCETRTSRSTCGSTRHRARHPSAEFDTDDRRRRIAVAARPSTATASSFTIRDPRSTSTGGEANS